VDVVLLPDKSRVELGVDPDRRWHLEEVRSLSAEHREPLSGKATLREEIRKSVAELFDAALESRAAIAIKGAPEQHAEGANVPGDEDG
jgi:hypothetical protein